MNLSLSEQPPITLPVLYYHVFYQVKYILTKKHSTQNKEDVSRHNHVKSNIYNPQNETCNAPGTKGAKIKTKREAKIKRSVPSVRFFIEPVFIDSSKFFDPASPGSVNQPPAHSCSTVYLNGLRKSFEGRSFRVLALRFGSLRDRFSALASSLTRPRSSPCTRPRSAL